MEPIMLTKFNTTQQRHTIFTLLLNSGGIICSQPVHASSIDYGFDIDEDELADGLFSSLPACVIDQPILHVGADEFDVLYHWFNS
jgi:hypothetical protein